MKYLLAIALMTSVAYAQDAKKADVKTEKADSKKDAKKAFHSAYKAAKEACLTENKDLKGKQLKECIISKTK